MKSHLVIFEEKLDISELTDREKMAYDAGKKDGIGKSAITFFFGYVIGIIFILFVFTVTHQINW